MHLLILPLLNDLQLSEFPRQKKCLCKNKVIFDSGINTKSLFYPQCSRVIQALGAPVRSLFSPFTTKVTEYVAWSLYLINQKWNLGTRSSIWRPDKHPECYLYISNSIYRFVSNTCSYKPPCLSEVDFTALLKDSFFFFFFSPLLLQHLHFISAILLSYMRLLLAKVNVSACMEKL